MQEKSTEHSEVWVEYSASDWKPKHLQDSSKRERMKEITLDLSARQTKEHVFYHCPLSEANRKASVEEQDIWGL